jgi:hypothetical protein
MVLGVLAPPYWRACRGTLVAPWMVGNLPNPASGAFVSQDARPWGGLDGVWIPRPAGYPDWSYNHPDFIASAPCGSVGDHRIHSGGNAQRIFQYFGTYVAGLHQQVNVSPGSDLRLTAFGRVVIDHRQPQTCQRQLPCTVGLSAGSTSHEAHRVVG